MIKLIVSIIPAHNFSRKGVSRKGKSLAAFGFLTSLSLTGRICESLVLKIQVFFSSLQFEPSAPFHFSLYLSSFHCIVARWDLRPALAPDFSLTLTYHLPFVCGQFCHRISTISTLFISLNLTTVGTLALWPVSTTLSQLSVFCRPGWSRQWRIVLNNAHCHREYIWICWSFGRFGHGREWVGWKIPNA